MIKRFIVSEIIHQYIDVEDIVRKKIFTIRNTIHYD